MNKDKYELKKQINFNTIKKNNLTKRSGFNPYYNIYNNITPENTINLQNTEINKIKNEVKTEINNDMNKKNTKEIEIIDNILCKDSI